jgi:hypothetical protein
MGAKHLNLEFEDDDEDLSSEEEAKQKREEEERRARELAQEIEFVATDPNITITNKGISRPEKPAAAPVVKQAAKPAPSANVTPIRQQAPVEATKPSVVATPAPVAAPAPAVQAPIQKVVATETLDTSRTYSAVEVEALIRAAVAESKLEYITDMAIETKLLEQKVNKILTMIFTKVPALKKEVMQVQKYLADHNQVVIPSKRKPPQD